MRIIFISLFFLVSGGFAWTQSNATLLVKGKVILPEKKKVIKRGDGYNNDGSPVMHSPDPLAMANNNIIVCLKPLDFKASPKPLKKAVITQKQQTFIPHVLPITTGTTVYLLNEDEFFHNIYSLKPGSRFNIGRRPPGSPYALPVKGKGAIRLSCDIHPHMEAYILSLDTPYFTRVKEDRTFDIMDIPPGNYQMEVFHPRFRKWTKRIQVNTDQDNVFEIDLSKQKAK